MNETIDVIRGRSSLRRYASEPLREEHVDLIVESALRAPTAGNMMLYSIVEIADLEKRAALATACGHAFIREAPLVLLFLADLQRWQDYYHANGVPEACRESGQPFRSPDLGKLFLGCCDALIAAHSSVLAAESLGIGSCYIGDILNQQEEHRALFDLPRWSFPIGLVCYGYPPEGDARSPTSRFDRRFIVFRDRYQRLGGDDLQEMLSEIETKFADVLRRKETTLAQMTHDHFSAAPAAIELAASVERALEDWTPT